MEGVAQAWRLGAAPYKRPRAIKRDTRPVPGDRVQIDTCKIGKNLYQFTAIDDCTRMRVLALYSGRAAPNADHFAREHLVKEFPFPIKRIQSDRGASSSEPSFKTPCASNASNTA